MEICKLTLRLEANSLCDGGATMLTDAMRSRFEEALATPQPYDSLNALAKSFKAEGVDQITIYRLFAEYHRKSDGDDPRCDAIMDNMDLIWGGPWAKGNALFDNELTRADLA